MTASSPRRAVDPALVARITALFTRSDGAYRFARWGRPLAPAFFGFRPDQRIIYRAALETAAAAAGLTVVDDDPDLGVNHLAFWCEGWDALKRVPGLDRLVPDLPKLVSVLLATGANQYRIFGFDDDGAIRLCVVLLRGDADLRAAPFPLLALSQAAQSMALWSDEAFRTELPVTPAAAGEAALAPWVAALLGAACATDMPLATLDADHAVQVAARMAAPG